jgi:hypothetical protein
MIRLILLLFILFFAACRKSDVATQPATTPHLPPDTSITYLPNQIRYGALKWVVHEDQQLLTADLFISKPYSISKIILIHAEGQNTFDIPKYNGTFTPTLYYKMDSNKVTIYAFYSAAVPPHRDEFEKESEYEVSLHYFALSKTGIGGIRIYFDSLSYDPSPGDSTLKDELSLRPMQWVAENEHLISATLDVPNGYSVTNITMVRAIGEDSIEVPRYDSLRAQKIYYKTLTRQIVVYEFTEVSVPLPEDFDNPIEYAITLLYWKMSYVKYHTFIVKFK